MKNNKVLIVKNITREGPGLLAQVLKGKNISFDIVDLGKGELLPNPEEYSAVFVFGGPDSANDTTTKMHRELTYVKEILNKKIPYLGICLGLQILVKVAGGEVIKSPYKEIGFKDHEKNPFEIIMLTQTGKHDLLFNGMGEHFKVFQLHGETVNITDSMKLLAIGKWVKNQIVKVSDKAYGIQCHFELTEEMLNLWIKEDSDLSQLDKNHLEKEFESIRWEYTKIGKQFFTNFLQIARLIEKNESILQKIE